MIHCAVFDVSCVFSEAVSILIKGTIPFVKELSFGNRPLSFFFRRCFIFNTYIYLGIYTPLLYAALCLCECTLFGVSAVFGFGKITLWCGWWMLKHEIQYLNARFREARQQGDMMVDFEAVYGALDEYLTGGQNQKTHSGTPVSPERGGPELQGEAEDFQFESDDFPGEVPPVFGEEIDLAEAALEHVRNGVEREQPANAEDLADSDFEETEIDRRRRYSDANQDEVSDPEFWAEVHYGEADEYNYERMVAFSRANQVRLRNALASLHRRREDAVNTQNWGLVEQYSKAIAEIESLQDICLHLAAFVSCTFSCHVCTCSFMQLMSSACVVSVLIQALFRSEENKSW